MIILLKLVLAHIIGDFILQPNSWVKNKEKRKLKSAYLYIHIGIHAALMFLLIYDLSYWPLLLCITLCHFLIDALKLVLQSKKTKSRWFFIDQLLHIISIFISYYVYTGISVSTDQFPTEYALLLLTCMVFLTNPVSIIMQTIFSKWNIEKLTKDNESLKDAGKYIGVLERLLVFIFIITNHWEAVGFLITAKSVFRFGDLKESKHRKLTEYILIGTLISFGIAIITGLTFNLLA
ncbi:DUF3307 domain-containing protein [Bizionia sp. KMM 8389]